MKRTLQWICILVLIGTPIPSSGGERNNEAGWISLFDGQSLTGWKASQYEDSFSVENGAIVAHGKPFSHLFYVGPVNGSEFKNFEAKVEVITKPNSNSGFYFHTKHQPQGWPAVGFEVQVNNTYPADNRKTGSLYRVQDVLEAPAKDDVWFTVHILVQHPRVVVKIDSKTVVDWIQPQDWQGVLNGKVLGQDYYPDRRLSSGTFALQAHDKNSIVFFRNIRVKLLP